MDRKQIFIEILLHKGIYKVGDKQLWEFSEEELARLLEGGMDDGKPSL